MHKFFIPHADVTNQHDMTDNLMACMLMAVAYAIVVIIIIIIVLLIIIADICVVLRLFHVFAGVNLMTIV